MYLNFWSLRMARYLNFSPLFCADPVGQCRKCPGGTATMDGYRCIPCPSGYWSNEGARECTACPAGTIAKPAALTARAKYSIDPTTYHFVTHLAMGPESCKKCPKGYFQPNIAGTVCLPCPSGKVCGWTHLVLI